MADGRGVGLGTLIAAKVVCCGGLALLATGALSGLGIWLADRWYVWIGSAIVVAAALVLTYRRRCRGDVHNGAISKCGASVTGAPIGGSAEYGVTFSPADGDRRRRIGRN